MGRYNPGSIFVQTSGFGQRTNPFNSSQKEIHTGIDFQAPVGTAIPAASDGRVVYSTFNQAGYGYTVIIKSVGQDGSAYFTMYAHMTGGGMPAYGSTVHAGDTIGQVGNTGSSTGAHLHFEVINGSAGVNETGIGDKIGITKYQVDRRVDPETFDNWAGGQPHGSENPVQYAPGYDLYNPHTWYEFNSNSLYETDKFVLKPRGGPDESGSQGDSFISAESITADGKIVETVYDENGAVSGVYTLDQNLHVLQFRDVNSDGTAAQYDFNADGHAASATLLDVQSRIDKVETVNADGSRAIVDYDQSGTQPWSQQTTRTDAQGRTDSIDTLNDNGTRTLTDFDQAGTQPWSSLVQDFNAQNQIIDQTVNNDSGTHTIYYWDPQNLYPWSLVTQDFNAQDQITHQTNNFDDGRRNEQAWDPSNQFSWSFIGQGPQRPGPTHLSDDQKTAYYVLRRTTPELRD